MTLGSTAHATANRTLEIYAPTTADPALLRQRSLLATVRPGLAERDLRLTEIIGKRPHFEAVLIGKDGGEKLRSPDPLTPERLFEIIDAMPMRRQELRR